MDEKVKQKENGAIFDRILEVTKVMGVILIMFMALAICVHVGMRYIFGKPMNWVIDVSSILLLYTAFLGAAWLLREEGHVAVDFIFAQLKPRNQFLLQIINSIICMAVCAIITVYGIIETISVLKLDLYVDNTLDTPKWVVIVIIPLGSVLLFIQFIRRTRGFIKKFKSYEDKKMSV
ncbi:TRAP transporter small permease [Thermodesulfobacteriota bacterium]